MFERFTDRARRVVVLAQEEARLLGHGYIGTEHLLLGLIQENEGVAGQVLAEQGIRLEPARQQARQIIGPGKQQVRQIIGPGKQSGHIPFTPRSKKVLELSLREARQLGHEYIGTEHILLGLIREGEGVAVHMLRALGAQPQQVREGVLRLLHGGARAEPRARGPRAYGELRYRAATSELLRRLDEISARLEAIEQHLGITRPAAAAGRASEAGEPPAEPGQPGEPGEPGEAGEPGEPEGLAGPQ